MANTYNEMLSLTLNGKKYDSFRDQTARQQLEEMKNNGSDSSQNPDFDPNVWGLPVVLALAGDTTGMTKENAVPLSYVYGDRNGECTVKWQGRSSLAYPKKNYTIKFDNAFEAATGWGEQKKYCLKANFIDHSHARNVVSAKLWGQIVKTRAYLPDAENLFDISRITGTPSTWEGATTFDADGVLTPGSTVGQTGYNPFNGLIFPAGSYHVQFEVCTTDYSKFGEVYFGFSAPGEVSADAFDLKILNRESGFPTVTDANQWGAFEWDFTITENAGFFIQPDADPSYYRFRNIEITSASDANVGGPVRLLDLPNGGAIDGFPVIITLNGDFHGLYTFNIPKDGWMLGMGSGEREAILCADYSDASWFRGEATLDGDFDLEYVTDENNAEWVKTSVNRLITAVVNSDGTDLDSTIAQYLDWDSAIDYLIFKSLLNGIDISGKNYILATYDGVKWFFSAYDMDCVYGLDWDGERFYPATPGVVMNETGVDKLIMGYKKDAFKARYKKLRSGVMSDDNVITTFINFIGSIPAPVYTEDAKTWPTIPNTATNNLSQIVSYYRMRAAALDKAVEAL